MPILFPAHPTLSKEPKPAGCLNFFKNSPKTRNLRARATRNLKGTIILQGSQKQILQISLFVKGLAKEL